jgi:transposase
LLIDFPNILTEAIENHAAIYFEDESGISLNVFSGKSWSKRGQTPVIYRSGQRVKRTIASAVSLDGDLYFETFEGGTNAERYKTFLEHLTNIDDKNKIIIHDGLPSHRSLKVKEYIDSTNGKLKVYQLPGYSPELNPDELVWSNLKRQLGKRAYKNIEELTQKAEEIMNNMKIDRALLSKYSKKIYGKL